jgi:8-oxo-dGTP pyrophosphatase MutT (NUDIX family)
MPENKKPWRQISTQEVFSNRYFRLRIDECELGNGKIMPKYFILDFPDWVQVVALNKRNELILVEQYRYPGEGWFLEFPGGSTHPNRNEEPLLAAQRELREETGYTSTTWQSLGHHYPNPALLNNKCHVFLALECEKTHDLELDPFEVLEVRELQKEKFENEFLKSNKIHSLMLATYLLYLKKQGSP